MHALRAADDRVYRACRNTQSAPDTPTLVDNGNQQRALDAVRGIQRQRCSIEQLREGFDAVRTARRTLIDVGFARRDRFGVRAATFVAALRALRLRQKSVDSIGHRHSVYL